MRYLGARLGRCPRYGGAAIAATLLAASLLGASGAAHAADAPPLSHNDPTQALPAPAPAPSSPLNLPTAPTPNRAQDRSVRLTLLGVKFNGAVAVPEARLALAWSDLQGKPVSLADLRAVGHRAEAIYASAGFPFVAVVLRVQEVKDGIVNFDVVEGRISDLTVLGSNIAARRQATAALQPLVNRAPLSLGDVETAYQLAKQVPGAPACPRPDWAGRWPTRRSKSTTSRRPPIPSTGRPSSWSAMAAAASERPQ